MQILSYRQMEKYERKIRRIIKQMNRTEAQESTCCLYGPQILTSLDEHSRLLETMAIELKRQGDLLLANTPLKETQEPNDF